MKKRLMLIMLMISIILNVVLVYKFFYQGEKVTVKKDSRSEIKMTKENREGLLNDKKRLAEVLKYHVVKGKYSAADLASRRALKTLQGEDLMIDNKDGTVVVDGCIVTKADVAADNGVIHVIDAVAIPERGK